MQRASMWLNLYGHQAVRLKNGFFRILEKTTSELICTRLYVSINYLRKTEASKSLFIEILLISCTKQANLKYATLYYIGLFFSVPNAAYPPMHLSRRTAAMVQSPLLKTTSWCEKSFCSSCHFSFVFRFSGGDVKQPKNKGNQSRYIF